MQSPNFKWIILFKIIWISSLHIQSSYRYYNVYGNQEDHKGDQASPISKFTKQVRETGKLKLFTGSHEFLRDFVCVNDIVNVVLDNDKPSGIYDLGTSKPISVSRGCRISHTKRRWRNRIHSISRPPS
jgi:hypothetical protein